ncbi:RICIN domain-containing protein [Lentzea chajnantorensis]
MAITPPDPDDITSAADFVAGLRRLRQWSGYTFRQLEGKAAAVGDVLPSSTTATALNRSSLPREQLVSAFVRACGLDDDAVRKWLDARQRLATGIEPPPPVPTPRKRRRFVVPLAIGLVVVIAATATFLLWPTGPRNGRSLLKVGDLCVGEGRERNGRTDRELAVLRPCEGVVPETSLTEVAPDTFQIEWFHPRHGVGCLGVDDAKLEAEALVSPHNCTGAAHQRFLFEADDDGGYRLRPVHSGLCIGVLGGPSDLVAGSELAQQHCSGEEDQRFTLVST